MRKWLRIAIILFFLYAFTSANASEEAVSGKGLFEEKDSFTVSVLPGSLIEVEDGAFENTSFEIVELPAELKTVGDYAFADISSLRILRFASDYTDIGENAVYDSKHIMIAGPVNSTISEWALVRGAPFSPISMLGTKEKGIKITGIILSGSIVIEKKGTRFLSLGCDDKKVQRKGRTIGELKASHFKGIAAQHIQSRYFP